MAITAFVVVILVIVAMGWRWTARHQAPPLSTASHIVLAVAAFAAIFAVARIWRADGPPPSSGNS